MTNQTQPPESSGTDGPSYRQGIGPETPDLLADLRSSIDKSASERLWTCFRSLCTGPANCCNPLTCGPAPVLPSPAGPPTPPAPSSDEADERADWSRLLRVLASVATPNTPTTGALLGAADVLDAAAAAPPSPVTGDERGPARLDELVDLRTQRDEALAKADKYLREATDLRIEMFGGCGCPAPYDLCPHSEPLLDAHNRVMVENERLRNLVPAAAPSPVTGDGRRFTAKRGHADLPHLSFYQGDKFIDNLRADSPEQADALAAQLAAAPAVEVEPDPLAELRVAWEAVRPLIRMVTPADAHAVARLASLLAAADRGAPE